MCMFSHFVLKSLYVSRGNKTTVCSRTVYDPLIQFSRQFRMLSCMNIMGGPSERESKFKQNNLEHVLLGVYVSLCTASKGQK